VRLRVALGFALIIAILLALPASALAGDGFDLKFQFTASDGYKITVAGYDATAVITVTKPSRSHDRAWSTYIARGKSTNGDRCRFEALGTSTCASVRQGALGTESAHKHCVGADRYTIQPGVFVGSVRFRGEHGYASANVHRVKGKVVTPRFLKCLDSFFEEFERSRGRADG